MPDQESPKKCIVHLKRGVAESGIVYGEILDHLEPCCGEFNDWFSNSGNDKITSFSYSGKGEERNGFNLVRRGNDIIVLLRATSPFKESKINHCLCCGAKVEIRITKTVRLVPKQRMIPDGYEETPYEITG